MGEHSDRGDGWRPGTEDGTCPDGPPGLPPMPLHPRPFPLPGPDPQPLALPPRSHPGFGLSPDAPEEPSLLWRLAVRYKLILLACAAASLAGAWVVGRLFAAPVWQAETVLLHQLVPMTPQQEKAYRNGPTLPTLADWVKEPSLLGEVIHDCGLDLTPAEFAEKHLKVDQPLGTETVSVAVKWRDRERALEILDRLVQRFIGYVVAERKRTILRGIIQSYRQEWAESLSEIEELEGYVRELEGRLAQKGTLTGADLDGALVARRNTMPRGEPWKNPWTFLDSAMLTRRSELQEKIRINSQLLPDLKADLIKKQSEYQRYANLGRSGAVPQSELDNLAHDIQKLGRQIRNTEESLRSDREEFRTLPIRLARTKMKANRDQADFLEELLPKLEEMAKLSSQPSGPPAEGVLVGMDAAEFTVKPLWADYRPVSSNRKTLMALAFLGLMAGAFSLVWAFDRFGGVGDGSRSGRPGGGPRSAQLFPVARRDERGGRVTIAHVETRRLDVRIHQWIEGNSGANDAAPPPLTIGPNGHIEEPADNEDARHLAQRMEHWLERKKN